MSLFVNRIACRAPERIISCPFNKAHQIAQSRMQTHLVRCRKDHEGELIYCPYNTTHMVADPEFMVSILICLHYTHYYHSKHYLINIVNKTNIYFLTKILSTYEIQILRRYFFYIIMQLSVSIKK